MRRTGPALLAGRPDAPTRPDTDGTAVTGASPRTGGHHAGRVIVAAARSPIGRAFKGSLAAMRADDMAAR